MRPSQSLQGWVGSGTHFEGEESSSFPGPASRVLPPLGGREGFWFSIFCSNRLGPRFFSAQKGAEEPGPHGPPFPGQCHSHALLVPVSRRPGKCAGQF